MSEYRIYRHVVDADHYDKESPPFDVNFTKELSIRLHPQITWTKGRITRIEYYEGAQLNLLGEQDPVGDLIVAEDFVYTNDAQGMARYRTQTITWYLESGAAGDETKVRPKVYGNAASRTEGRRRRRNVIDNMSIAVVGLLAQTETAGNMATAIDVGQAYMTGIESKVVEYIELGTSVMTTQITSDTTSWLDNVIPNAGGATIRMFILGELS